MNQKPGNVFALLAKSVLPEQTSGRLARMADVNHRIAQRGLAGDLDATDFIVERLEAQKAQLATFQPGGELTRLIVRAQCRLGSLALPPLMRSLFIPAHSALSFRDTTSKAIS